MSKLLEALLADGRAADHKCAFPWTHADWLGSGVVEFYSGSDGYVSFKLKGVPGGASYGDRVTRSEFDAAMKQYPSATQTEIAAPDGCHAVLERILKVMEASNADEACEKYCDLLDESVTYVTLLELLECENGDEAVVKTKKLIREHGAYKDARVKLREALGIGQHVDVYAHIEQLNKDRELLKDRNREIVKLNDELSQLVHYVHETFYPNTGKLVLFRDVTMRLDQLAGHVRGIPVAPSPTQCTNVLHAAELYRNATVLLQTTQLVVWRDADNQEHSAPAHQVTLNPDDNGLAAAILSRIGQYDVAPEHIAEMRSQMGWGSHGE